MLFVGIMLFLAGIWEFFDAIWAFSYHGVLPANLEGAIFGHSPKTYGWVDLIVAAILVVCAFAARLRPPRSWPAPSSIDGARSSAPSR